MIQAGCAVLGVIALLSAEPLASRQTTCRPREFEARRPAFQKELR